MGRLWRGDHISIHAPREGGDGNPVLGNQTILRFQSTPPARGATGFLSLAWDAMNISIHAPREGGDIDIDDLQECMDISIHAPREGGDCASRRG